MTPLSCATGESPPGKGGAFTVNSIVGRVSSWR
jgi:hypothetical protein